MNLTSQPKILQRKGLVIATIAALSLGAAASLQAATPEPAKAAQAPIATAPAQQCLTDLSVFHGQMNKAASIPKCNTEN